MTGSFRRQGEAAPAPMVRLRTVSDVFGARVLAARLGADGIITELRGGLGGPYPIGCVSVWVRRDDAEVAAELLLADEIEAAFDTPDWEPGDEWEVRGPRRLVFGWTARRLVAALALVLILAAVVGGRLAGV